MIYEPGPITIDALPRPTPIVHDGTFTHLLEPLVAVLGASDEVLSAHQRVIASTAGDGLDARFASTIGRAADALAAQPDPYADQTAARLIDRGAGAGVHYDNAQAYLPDADAPITQDFKEFPQPPFGHPSGTGPDPGDPNKD